MDGDPCDFTYDCPLERILGNACDFIEFQSIELAELEYPPYPQTLEARKLFPFVSYREHLKDGPLCIQGSETQVDTAPVFLLEYEYSELWFPSLTNMMLVMAECLETVGTVLPTCCFDINLDPDFVDSIEGTNEYRDMVRQKEEAVTVIAKKYGSPKGGIVL